MRSRQQGAALMMALVILLIMTLIGLSALQTSTLDMKIVANLKENVSAYHNAETGMGLAFEEDIDILNADSYSFVVTGATLGADCATVTMTITDPDDEAGAGSEWGDDREMEEEDSDQVRFPAFGASTHAVVGKEWVMTADAERCSNAKATHQRAFVSSGAGS